MAEDEAARGVRIVSVFGPFASRALVEMPVGLASELFGEPSETGPSEAIEGVRRDLEDLEKRDPGLSESALAATARTLAREMDHPHNSATSKSMCARALLDTLERLTELAPAEEESDRLDDLSSRRKARLAGGAGA